MQHVSHEKLIVERYYMFQETSRRKVKSHPIDWRVIPSCRARESTEDISVGDKKMRIKGGSASISIVSYEGLFTARQRNLIKLGEVVGETDVCRYVYAPLRHCRRLLRRRESKERRKIPTSACEAGSTV